MRPDLAPAIESEERFTDGRVRLAASRRIIIFNKVRWTSRLAQLKPADTLPYIPGKFFREGSYVIGIRNNDSSLDRPRKKIARTAQRSR